MSRLISFAVLIAIIIFIGLLFYKVLIGFFVPVFLASVLVVVFRPLHRWVLEMTGQREQVAAAITTFLIMAALILPFGVVLSSAAVQGLRLLKNNDVSVLQLKRDTLLESLGLTMPAYELELATLEEDVQRIVGGTSNEPRGLVKIREESQAALEALKTRVIEEESQETYDSRFAFLFERLEEQLGQVGVVDDEAAYDAPARLALDLKSTCETLKERLLGGPIKAIAREYANPDDERLEEIRNRVVAYAQPRLLSLTGATGALLVKLIFSAVILVVATFFFLYDGPSMINTIMRLSPLDDTYEQELLLEFDRISRAVVLATVLSAITQGLTAGVGYYFAGMDFLVLLISLTTIFAMVPFVGPAVVWLPVCLYIGIYDGRVLAASLLALWGVLVVGTIDNLVKAFVLHGQSQLHPLLALLSVLGGVQTLGPVGIVVGPMVVAMLQTLLGILQRELLHFDNQQIVLQTGEGGGSAGSRVMPRKSFQGDPETDSPAERSDESKEVESATADNPAQNDASPATQSPSAPSKKSRRKTRRRK